MKIYHFRKNIVYIVFEGIVGSGKSTQAKKLVEFFREKYGTDMVVYVREPGSTPIAEDIRHLAQKKEWENESMHPLTNAYLYAAARAQTIHTIVKPALESGKMVISDRSFISSCAIQWEAQWLGINTVLRINKSAVGKIFPDLVFYMDIDVDVSLSRTFDSSGDKFEREWRQFYEAIVRGYEKCEKLEIMKKRFIRIDANVSQDKIFQNILTQLDSI